jgi:uncharacterized iron-regulated membrane protein
MIRTARVRFPDAEFLGLSMPRKDSGFITLRMKQPGEWLPNDRSNLYFAADTGDLIDARDARASPLQVRGYKYPLFAPYRQGSRTAERVLMTLSGLALALLGSLTVWTFWMRTDGKKARI